MLRALAAGNKDLPQLLHQVLVLTLCQLSGNASVQPIVQGMAERAGFATLLKMVGKQMAVHHMVHIWGPTACRWGCAGILLACRCAAAVAGLYVVHLVLHVASAGVLVTAGSCPISDCCSGTHLRSAV